MGLLLIVLIIAAVVYFARKQNHKNNDTYHSSDHKTSWFKRDTYSTPSSFTPSQKTDSFHTNAKRCDQCGASAYYRAMKSHFLLLFCKHHHKKNEETLIERGFIIEPV